MKEHQKDSNVYNLKEQTEDYYYQDENGTWMVSPAKYSNGMWLDGDYAMYPQPGAEQAEKLMGKSDSPKKNPRIKVKSSSIHMRAKLLTTFSELNYSPSSQMKIADHFSNIKNNGLECEEAEAEAERIIAMMKTMPEAEVLENL